MKLAYFDETRCNMYRLTNCTHEAISVAFRLTSRHLSSLHINKISRKKAALYIELILLHIKTNALRSPLSLTDDLPILRRFVPGFQVKINNCFRVLFKVLNP